VEPSRRYGFMFLAAFVGAGLIISTVVFPFWNFIRADVFEEVEILSNENGVCYVESSDSIPKTIENCNLEPGSLITIKYGEGLAWATIASP